MVRESFLTRLFNRRSGQAETQQAETQVQRQQEDRRQREDQNALLERNKFIMQSVSSTNVKRIGYNAEYRRMRVEFLNGSAYQYFNVDPGTYTNVRSGRHQARYPKPHKPSIGSALDAYIKKAGVRYQKE